MKVSVIICTIRREELIAKALDSLVRQSFRDFEVLLVKPPTEEPVAAEASGGFPLRRLEAPKGLPRARNVGLEHAQGEFICFLDDDVVLESDFLAVTVAWMDKPELADVGGMTGYDTANYGRQLSGRWKMRHRLGMLPTLEPGGADHLGRSVPLAFFAPFQGCREVKWLPGFCQIFRRSVIEGMRYDELSVVEDRDFSMEVARKSRLVACGELRLAHMYDKQGRHRQAVQVRRAAFGLGRSYAKRRRSFRDWGRVAWTLVGEFLLDMLVLVKRPNWENLKTSVYRLDGFVAGFTSLGQTKVRIS